MNKTFCSNCGTKHEYSSAKPKFCMNCGKKMGESTASSRDSDDDSDNDDEDSDGSIDKNISIKVDLGGRESYTFGDLVKDSGPPVGDKIRRSSGGSNLVEVMTKKLTEVNRIEI